MSPEPTPVDVESPVPGATDAPPAGPPAGQVEVSPDVIAAAQAQNQETTPPAAGSPPAPAAGSPPAADTQAPAPATDQSPAAAPDVPAPIIPEQAEAALTDQCKADLELGRNVRAAVATIEAARVNLGL